MNISTYWKPWQCGSGLLQLWTASCERYGNVTVQKPQILITWHYKLLFEYNLYCCHQMSVSALRVTTSCNMQRWHSASTLGTWPVCVNIAPRWLSSVKTNPVPFPSLITRWLFKPRLCSQTVRLHTGLLSLCHCVRQDGLGLVSRAVHGEEQNCVPGFVRRNGEEDTWTSNWNIAAPRT